MSVRVMARPILCAVLIAFSLFFLLLCISHVNYKLEAARDTWNEFLFAVTITTSTQYPIMVGLQNLSGSQIVQWNIQMAGAILAALPTLLVYIFLGKYFVKGLFAGSLKG